MRVFSFLGFVDLDKEFECYDNKVKPMKHFICLCLILLSIDSNAAETKKAYFKKKESLFSRPTLIVDGKDYKTTFWKAEFEIQDAVKSNPQAFESVQKYKNHSDKAAFYIWGGLGLALGYLFATDRDDFSDTIYWGIFGTGFVMNIHEQSKAGKELKRTINFYNGDF